MVQKSSVTPVRLTPRQLDCLVLVAKGKTDWEIATVLGLKESTVNGYIDDAKTALSVTRRSQLVTRALLDGHLRLADTLDEVTPAATSDENDRVPPTAIVTINTPADPSPPASRWLDVGLRPDEALQAYASLEEAHMRWLSRYTREEADRLFHRQAVRIVVGHWISRLLDHFERVSKAARLF